jgi:hypothetical protein
MMRVTNSRLRNFAFMKTTPKPNDPDPPTREEWQAMANELLELRKVADLAFMYFEQEDMDPPDDEDAMDAHQREIDETGEKLRMVIETYRKGK